MRPSTETASWAQREPSTIALALISITRASASSTSASATSPSGQPALTAEYKLNLLSPAVGERLICRARVIKPGRQVAVVAADVFCVTDGVEHCGLEPESAAQQPDRVEHPTDRGRAALGEGPLQVSCVRTPRASHPRSRRRR